MSALGFIICYYSTPAHPDIPTLEGFGKSRTVDFSVEYTNLNCTIPIYFLWFWYKIFSVQSDNVTLTHLCHCCLELTVSNPKQLKSPPQQNHGHSPSIRRCAFTKATEAIRYFALVIFFKKQNCHNCLIFLIVAILFFKRNKIVSLFQKKG